jgi:mannose-6-phosphate isomerase-like protein (cupin superfamily)
MEHLESAGTFSADEGPNAFVEHLRVPTMSVGTYSIPVSGADDQVPHDEDEVYVVIAGRGRITAGATTLDIEPGTTLFVPAGEEHRFHDVAEDLALLVLFAPPYSGD